ncbi:glycosyltransferase family 4 protein [Acaryochloris marina]|uniref:Glycosyl transferase, group 1 family protein n=2 Tax=Acaryochloris marina TaxID=155978 RepID=B0CE26_ACAM1|nr:glycosyltransferase family 4 protein [Acaryochloris marina]ABW30500.1 glycosyl transferase, group 1 family protein [Acaryochloris marina MBIC11017]
MRILSVHNYYKIRGGEDESCKSEKSLLREMGHLVDEYEKDNISIPSYRSWQLATQTIWSQESYQAVRQKLQHQPYDVVHVQNSFPLISPSVYYAAQAEGVPVIQTIRNYRLLCPNALFFRQGKVCEDCLNKAIPWPGIIHSCYRNNRLASGITASMISIHRLLKTWDRKVDKYIALTHFARNKLIQGGLPANKIIVKPNFVNPDPGVGHGKGQFALYVGRLSVEKGLDTLLSAWDKLQSPFPLRIVGDGPLSELVLDKIKESPHISWLGRKSIDEVHQLMGEASFLIFPSKWYETFGRVAIEAFAKGTPVIASQIGAIAELVEHKRTGLQFQPGDSLDLAEQVEWALSHPEELQQMRLEVRQEFEAKYTARANYQQLIEIYRMAANN